MAWGIVVKLIIVTTILVFVGAALPSQAQAAITRYDLNIPREPLDLALKQFADQTGLQIARFSDVAQGSSEVGPLVGQFTTEEALGSLLAGSGLTYRVLTHRTIAIVGAQANRRAAVPAAGGSQDGKEGKTSSSPGFRVAQVAQGAGSGTDSVKSAEQRSASEESPLLQEIIVTAQKYSQRAFDVPISLDVISGAELLAHGITDLSNLQYDVPGLFLNNTGTTHAVYLRGVGNNLGTGAMVGTYVNDADTTAATVYSGTAGYATNDDALYDLQRVEVLKGPQGTLYGDGSMGGVIRYITNDPVLDRVQMDADVAELFTQYGAPGQRVETMLNTPIIDGTLGLRFAGMFEHDGGWVDEPAANSKNINGGNLTDIRAEALWQPTERFKLKIMQTIHRHTSGLGEGEDANGNISTFFNTTYTPSVTDSSDLSNLSLIYDFADAQLLSSSTYLSGGENDYNQYPVTSVPGYPPFVYLLPYWHVNNEDYSEELRLTNKGGGAWHWTVGSLYKKYHDTVSFPGEYYGVDGTASASSLATAIQVPGLDERDSSSSWAGFADTSYRPLNRLTVGAGVRYFKDRETTRSATELGYLSPSTGQSIVPNPSGEATFTSTDPRFYVQYQVSPQVNTYASASKGFRSGGFNSPPAPNYGPEVLWSYDLGTKLRIPQEHLRADVDLFDMNYSNYVSDTYVPPNYLYTNVGRARIQGVDADLTWRPIHQWVLAVNTEVLRTKFLTASDISGYEPGERLPFAPTYSFTASVQRDFRVQSKPGTVELYYYEISRVQYRLAGVPLFESDIPHFLNIRTNIDWSDNLSLGFFVHNILNDRGQLSPLYYTAASMRPRPRTFGLEFHASLGQ